MTNFRNLFIISGLAFLAALPLGILAIRLPGGFSSIYLYAAVSVLVSWLYLYSLRRLLGFDLPPKHGWFIVRGGLVDPVACVLIAIPFAGGTNGTIVTFCMAFHVTRLAAFVLLARHYINLRPFVRGNNPAAPWPHHDGRTNGADSSFFRTPPEWLGDVLTAASSLRHGDEVPPGKVILALILWGAALICLLSLAILHASHTHLSNLPAYLAPYAIFGTFPTLLFLLYRKRICSYVGTNGAIEYQMELDGSVAAWEARYADYRHLKRDTTVYYRGFAGFRSAYIDHCETRCFESADGSVKHYYSFQWQDPSKTGTDGSLPDIRATFWDRIESVWAMGQE